MFPSAECGIKWHHSGYTPLHGSGVKSVKPGQIWPSATEGLSWEMLIVDSFYHRCALCFRQLELDCSMTETLLPCWPWCLIPTMVLVMKDFLDRNGCFDPVQSLDFCHHLWSSSLLLAEIILPLYLAVHMILYIFWSWFADRPLFPVVVPFPLARLSFLVRIPRVRRNRRRKNLHIETAKTEAW